MDDEIVWDTDETKDITWDGADDVVPTSIVEPVRQQSTIEALSDTKISVEDFIKSINTSDALKVENQPELMPDQKSDMMEQKQDMMAPNVTVSDAADNATGVLKGATKVFGDIGAEAVNLLANVAGMVDEDAEKSMKEFTKKHKDILKQRVKEAGTAGEIGEFLGNAVGATKKLSQLAVMEGIKSIGRNELFQDDEISFDKFSSVAVEAGTAIAFGALINKFFPAVNEERITGAGISFESLSKSEQAAKIGMINQAKKLGIDRLDDEARDKIIMQIMKPEKVNINAIINAKLKEAATASKDNYTKLYSVANKQGMKFGAIPKNKLSMEIAKGISKASDTGTLGAAEKKMAKAIQREIAAYGDTDKVLNVADINSISKSISRLGKTEAGKAQGHILKTADEFLTKYSDDVLEKAGQPKIYAKAKEAFIQHQTKFLGKIEGEGQIAGKAIKKVLAEETGDASKLLFGSGMPDADIAKRMAKELSASERSALVLHQVTKGLDINVADDVSTALSRFKRMNPEALSVMVGSKASRELSSNLKLLSEINKTGGKLIETSLGQDLTTIVLGSTVKMIHPLRGATMALQGASNILRKTTDVFSRYDKLIAQTKLIKAAPIRNKALHLINKMYAGYKSDGDSGSKSMQDEADRQILKQYE